MTEKLTYIDHEDDPRDIPTLDNTPVGSPITSNPLAPLADGAPTVPLGGGSGSSNESTPAIQRDENTLTSHTIPVTPKP